MDKIDKDSSASSGVTFGECNVRRLLLTDDLVLLSSNKRDLQYALDWFSDACLNAGMKTSISISISISFFYFCSVTTKAERNKQTYRTIAEEEKGRSNKTLNVIACRQ